MAHVLVVDDERGLRITIKAFLEEEGHRVDTAQTFDEARRAFGADKFDVVVLDIVLPGGSGVELLQELRKVSPGTLGILITGDPSVDTATEALRTGAFDYLRKPVSKAIINRVVANAARIKSLNDERERLERENQAYREHLEELVEQRTRQLRDSERRYRLIAENASDVIWTMDFDLRETFITPSVEKVFGRTQQQSSQMTLQQKLTPESWLIASRRLKELQRYGELNTLPPETVITLELQEYHISGRPLWVEIQAGLLRDDDGRPIGILGVTRDINQRKEEELLRKKSEERLKLALEGTGAGLWDWNIETAEIYLSPMWSTILEYGSEEIKAGYDDILPLLHPEDLESIKQNMLRHFEGHTQSYESKFRVKAKSGSWKWVLARGKVVERNSAGQPLRVVGTHVDISEEYRLHEILRENEEKYRNLVELGSDGICIIKDYKFVYANRRLCEMLQVSPEGILDRPFTDFIAPDEQGFMKSLHEMHMGGERDMGVFDTVVVNTQGRHLQIEVNASIIPYENGEAELVAVRDISARKQAEKEIYRLNQFRMSVIDNANVWLSVMDDENRILIWNKAAERISGYSRDEVVGTDSVWRRLLPKNTCDSFLAGLERSNSRAEGEHFETGIITRDGREVFISWTSRKLLDENHQSIGSIMLGHDVSELHQSMEALRRSEEMIRSTLHSMSDMLFVVDRFGRMQDFHQPALEKQLYVRPEEFIGKPFESILPPEISRKFAEAIMQVASNGQTARVEYPLLIEDGEHWFSARISMRRDARGEYDGVTIVVRDDTDRRQAEESVRRSESQLRGIVTSLSKSAIVLIDRDGNYLAAWADREFDRRIGSVSSELPGRNMSETLAPDKLREFMQAIRNVSDTQNSMQFEYSVPGADGRMLWHEVTLSPMTREETETKAVVAMIHDITERKEAEEALRRSEEQLRGIVTSLHNNAIMVIDREGNTISAWADRDFENKSGYSANFFIGRNIKDILPPEESGWRMKIIEDIFRTGKSSTMEYFLYAPDGRKVWHESRHSAMLDSEGRVKAAVILMHDITDRKKAETALLAREAFENLIMSISTEFVNMKSDEIDAGIERALKLIGEFSDTDRSYIFLFDEALEECSNTHEWCRSGIAREKEHLQHCRTSDMPWWLNELRESKLIYLKSLDDMPPEAAAEHDVLKAQSIISLLAVPMHYSGRLIGFMGFDSVRSAKNWDDEIIKLLRVVSDLLANACMRKNYEKELRESEERYRAVVENAGEGIIVLDRNGRCLFINGTAAERRGGTAGDFIGRTLFDVYPAEVAERKLAAVRRVIDSGEGEVAEYQMPVNGEWRWFRLLLQPLKDGEGRNFAAMVLSFDTERHRRLLSELKQSRENVNAIFCQIQEFFIILDEDGTVLYANPYMHTRLGYSESEISGLDISRFVAVSFIKGKNQIFAGVPENGAKSMFIPFMAKNGAWIYTESRISRGCWEGQSVFFGVCRDLTERIKAEKDLKESEATARMLLDLMPTIAMLVDPNGPILAVNQKAAENMGMTEEEMLGRTPFEIFDRRTAEQRVLHFIEAVRTRRPVEYEDERDGRRFRHIVVPLFDDNGEIMRFAVFADLIEIRN